MSIVQITESRHFVAQHYHSLPGFCEPLHDHNWQVEVTVQENVPERLSEVLDAWVAMFDGTLLNEQEAIYGRNPTAEVLAECAFLYLMKANLCPLLVKVREKTNYWAACVNDKVEK